MARQCELPATMSQGGSPRGLHARQRVGDAPGGIECLHDKGAQEVSPLGAQAGERMTGGARTSG